MACRTTTVVKDVAIASRAEATHLRRRQAGPKTAPRGDPRPRRLDEMDVIHVGMRLFPDVDNKPRWPQIRQPIEAGAATGKADLRKAERRISGPAIAATPRVAQGLDLPDIVSPAGLCQLRVTPADSWTRPSRTTSDPGA